MRDERTWRFTRPSLRQLTASPRPPPRSCIAPLSIAFAESRSSRLEIHCRHQRRVIKRIVSSPIRAIWTRQSRAIALSPVQARLLTRAATWHPSSVNVSNHSNHRPVAVTKGHPCSSHHLRTLQYERQDSMTLSATAPSIHRLLDQQR